MSYSIGVRAANKDEAKAQLAEKFDSDVLANQPVHAKDRDAALATAGAFIDMLADDDGRDIQVNLSGSLGWDGDTGGGFITASNFSASAYYVARR